MIKFELINKILYKEYLIKSIVISIRIVILFRFINNAYIF
jgi:hypothetical protein